MDHLWQSVKDKFEAENMDNYRDATLRHMKDLWNTWRSNNHLNHIFRHSGNLEAIKADKPKEITQEDWEWLFTHRYNTDQFKKVSSTNRRNRQNVKYVHHTGSKSFTQLEREIELRDGRPPAFEDVFLETRIKKDRTVDPDVQLKVDEMRSMREKNPSISNIDLIESVFGNQSHGYVIGMGGGVLISQVRDIQSKQSLRHQNLCLQTRIEDVERAHQTELENLRAQRLNDKLEMEEARLKDKLENQESRLNDKLEMDKKIAAMMSQFLGTTSTSMPPTTTSSNSGLLNLDDEQIDFEKV
ncbi:uncharacterized protein LOC124929485 [Impatiens glandulifera]|uniref:uncharacterized protein LOC124929485 n=1 Tax=Impatiens glandulifera TaxID=253017 RepID=UPI001FB10B1F|nr:uncharacterized protein LOC124929485 [Impatiens glandulifera]